MVTDGHGALYLSYQDLPFHKLWIAEGFVEARGDVSLEETGEQYYRELLSRLLQSQTYRLDYDESSKMHDLLRSLGHFLSRDESLFISDLQKEPTSDGYTEEEIERIEKVLDVALHPSSSVVTFRLENFFGLRYPSWMASASISSKYKTLATNSLSSLIGHGFHH
ncbi:NB-ARC domain [Musa troglodytarum]|uniref:NB-ARC domain n=1 Tax=Musa troglodytarum TaxID=320322 RepID=A0A9E7E8U1_9LILI|nr:NB-ARC domain [Musa troglodytarum]